MPKIPDLTSHGSSVGIMVLMNFIFLAAAIFAYCKPCGPELRTLLSGAFTGYNGALLLCLKGASDRPSGGAGMTRSTDPQPAPEVK